MINQESQISFHLAQYKDQIDARLSTWAKSQFLKRLRDKDHTLWSPGPVPELTDRLGWLTLPEKMTESQDRILQFADEVKSDGISQVILLGMGGSSLAPELFAKSFGSAPGYPELIVLDSTHPDAVISVKDHLNLDKTFFIVSSKSGTTLETISLFRFFWEEMKQRGDHPGNRFAAITDPGSPLIDLAAERNFRSVFESPIDVGGRFSALSVFGLVPAALIGVDIQRLLDRAMRAADNCTTRVSEVDSTALILGAMLGELADDRNKVTFLASSSIESFSDWVEQLIAESTGKKGKGILPVVKELHIPVDSYGNDRMFVGLFLEGDIDSELEHFFNDAKAAGYPTVRIDLGDLYDLGQEIFRWEVAIAAACSCMGVNPFNQPDVQLSKNYARKAMKDVAGGGEALREIDSGLTATVSTADQERLALELEKWIGRVQPGDYLTLQAFLAPFPDVENALNGIRLALLERTHLATTIGYGPRYLHSTGQLHKGGPNCGLFLQLVAKSRSQVRVPETDYTFNSVIQAQGAGDYQALIERKRRILRVELDADVLGCLKKIRELIS